jgi:putative lipoprotein
MTTPSQSFDELIGSVWLLQSISGVTEIDTAKTMFVIQADGSVRTTVGCNQLSSKATIAGPKLSFAPFASTRMACEPALMAQEQAYEGALAATRLFRMSGTQLKFTDDNEKELLTFRRAP